MTRYIRVFEFLRDNPDVDADTIASRMRIPRSEVLQAMKGIVACLPDGSLKKRRIDEQVRPAAEARWYCLSREGMATLCVDEEDAQEVAAESWVAWPQNGPYRVAQMVDAGQVAAAVANERKHWRTLLSRKHVFNGSCPDAENWHDRDPECPACRALGEWRA